MPIVIKAQGNDSTHDVIKKFKKAVASTDIVQLTKDRRFYTKPSQLRQVKKTEIRRLRKRARALKKMKNIAPATLQKLMDRLDK